jgi:hypothetical protein
MRVKIHAGTPLNSEKTLCMQLLEDAWILKPASKKRPAGFVKNSELKAEEMQAIMEEIRGSGWEP